MELARKSAITTVVLSSVLMILFCFSTFITPIGTPSIVASVSAPVNFWKSPTVTPLGSLNWAGYALNGSVDSVTLVKGYWIQPTISCPTKALQVASFWIGMDGLTSPTVEQTGTLAQCYKGSASYSAWYEFYPNSSVNIKSLVIHPGDIMFAEVKYTSVIGKFNATIQDLSTGKSFSIRVADPAALRNSAEWIAEAPSSPSCATNAYDICPLANFGVVNFGRGPSIPTGTDVAKISGDSGPIAKFGKVDSLEMVSFASTPKAIESPIKIPGSSFAVTWA